AGAFPDAHASLNTSSATATFPSANVGTGIAVAVTGLTLSGAQSGNYTLAQPTGLAASITPAPLTVTGSTAIDKVYDRTTAATLNLGNAQLQGVLGKDQV